MRRRVVLKGFAACSALACTRAVQPAPDAAQCSSADICLDLSLDQYKALRTPGGSIVITAPPGLIIVMRVSATEVAALSATCTHAGCEVGYYSPTMLVVCPCHGSEFTIGGAVVQGPAASPLAAYQATLDTTTNIITVVP